MTGTSVNTLRRQLALPCGYAPVQAMIELGWLAEAALLLDALDDAGPLLANIGRYCFDKNMDYVDAQRGLDWRKWQWLVPEGVNLMPDGRWYRIGDLTNGANLGPVMHALELAAGVDDATPADVRVMPRAPDPLQGIEVEGFPVLVPEGDGLGSARLRYTFRKPCSLRLTSDRPLPALSVRLGPFTEMEVRECAARLQRPPESSVRVEQSGRSGAEDAWWVWVEELKDVTTLSLG